MVGFSSSAAIAPKNNANLPAAAPANVASASTTIVVVSHKGRVLIAPWAGEPQPLRLVPHDTLEVEPLDSQRRWSLFFDDGGFGALLDSGAGDVDPIIL